MGKRFAVFKKPGATRNFPPPRSWLKTSPSPRLRSKPRLRYYRRRRRRDDGDRSAPADLLNRNLRRHWRCTPLCRRGLLLDVCGVWVAHSRSCAAWRDAAHDDDFVRCALLSVVEPAIAPSVGGDHLIDQIAGVAEHLTPATGNGFVHVEQYARGPSASPLDSAGGNSPSS